MDDPAFQDAGDAIDLNTQTILLHASNHDLQALKPFLRIPGNASVQDQETGFTPLHAVIAACGDAKSKPTKKDVEARDGVKVSEDEADAEEEPVDIPKAKAVMQELFLSGAIWNDLDTENETPGCLAYRLGQMELYEMCVEAGVRAELLLALMGGYESLGSDDEDMEDADEVEKTDGEKMTETNGHAHELAVGPAEAEALEKEKKDVNSKDYLASELKFDDNKLVDADDNGVMMAWETDIMRRTVDLLLPSTSSNSSSLATGKRILNIGFGMGIIDTMFRDTKPTSHHIIEAHPSVLAQISDPTSAFHANFSSYLSPSSSAYKIHAGRWQDICPQLLEAGEIFDAIYFDTFGESYDQLKLFFEEMVPGLLDGEGRFGWFNGLGADRRVCYDVYCRVVEIHLVEAGMEVCWEDVAVPEGVWKDDEAEAGKGKGKEKGEWEGVRRKYWTLEKYRLPIATFMG
jgi:protein arginine N-methyltransferase 2